MDVVVRIPDMQELTSVTLPYFQMGRKRSFFSSVVSFPSGSDGKESTCNVGDLGSIPGSGRSIPVFLPGKSRGQRSLAYPWGGTESDMTE